MLVAFGDEWGQVLIFMLEKLVMLEFYYFFNLFCECRIWLFDEMNLRSFCLFCLRYTSWSWVWFEYSNKDCFLQNSVGIHYFCSVFAVEGKYCLLIFILLPVGLIGLIFLLFRLQLFCICLYGPTKYIQLQSSTINILSCVVVLKISRTDKN